MWILSKKSIIRLSTKIIRQSSNFIDDLGENVYEAGKLFLKNEQEKKKNAKSLRIAIIGLPNTGKSTLINHLMGRPVCATSMKVHTTQTKSNAIYCEDNIQLIFVDTPGVISSKDLKKYKLEKSLLKDSRTSIKNVDVVGLIQDVSNVLSRKSISSKILEVLNSIGSNCRIILVLNKIDIIENKKVLLDIVQRFNRHEKYPKFSDIFMISALTGDGIIDLKDYFLDLAKERPWEYNVNIFTDQTLEKVCEEIVRSKLLDNLPQEMPYQLVVQTEMIQTLPDGSKNIVTVIKCPSERLSRKVLGTKGLLVKKIALEAEEAMCAAFQTSVRLKIIIPMRALNNIKKHQN